MVRAVARIVVVGGGTAGWLTAGLIAARHQARITAGDLSVTLVESPDIPIIGVGEGTWPSLRTTLQKMGVAEADFLRECDAAFKQGSMFAQWTTGTGQDYYHHPFTAPQAFAQVNLVPHWLAAPVGRSFCAAASSQGEICKQGLGPKLVTTPEYQGVVNYAYHLDAGKFADFLTRHCTNRLGVRHIKANVREVRLSVNGDIACIETAELGAIEGDLFVDCTGASSLLLGKALGVPFRDCNRILFCDRALAVQVPHATPDAPIASNTLSTAQSSGWIWDIGLPTRRGIGHVYSSSHATDQQAEAALAAYVGPAIEKLAVRKIAIRSGFREQRWKNNCVAVGMAAGFLEPLEASAIVLIEVSAGWIAEHLPNCREVMDIIARRFNEQTQYHWGRIIDFLKLHYVLSKRTGAFWSDNADPASVPERLQELLALWKYHSPWNRDEFDRLEEMFPAASYQYVLYGMGFRTEITAAGLTATLPAAGRAFSDNLASTRRLLTQLPGHRDLLRQLRGDTLPIAT
jgi:tryptophan halogenase